MYLENLIQSIEGAKGVLLKKIESLGAKFYKRTEVKSPDDRLNLYSIGCSNPDLGTQEVFVGVQLINPEDATGIEGIISKTTRLMQVPGKREYRYGNNFSIRFDKEGSVIIGYRQVQEITNEEYRSRVEAMVSWLIDALRPRDERKTPIAGKVDISQEKTHVLEETQDIDFGNGDIDPSQIYGKVGRIIISNYHGKITISDNTDGSKTIILRLKVKGRSKGFMDGCVDKLREVGYTASVDERALWISCLYKSMPTKRNIKELRERLSVTLDIFGG